MIFLYTLEQLNVIIMKSKFTFKTLSFAITISILLFSNLNATYSQNGSIKGRVFDASNNESLPFTNLIILGTNIGVTSDTAGNFTFKGLVPGYVKIVASSVGYNNFTSEEILVTNSKVAFLDIPMASSNIQLEQFTVVASAFSKTEESPVSMRTLSIKDMERNPGGNRDVSKVIQALPGVASTVSFRNDVIVRGGGPSENRFYLDGIEIPNLNHFSTQGASGGPIGIINIDFIKEVDFYSGAFPANRGNTLSSVLEMEQIDGNKERIITKGAIGATDVSLAFNGPLSDNTTFLFSARRSYLKFLFDVIGLPFLPTYNDFQFKVKTKFDQKNELTVLGIGAIDEFKLNTNLENPDENQQYIISYLPVFEQWNYAIGAVYKHFRENSNDTWVFSRNMLNNTSYKHENNDESKPFIQNFISQEIENKFRYENLARINGFKILTGAGLEYSRYITDSYQRVYLPGAGDTLRTLEFDTNLDLFKWNLFAQVSKGYINDRLILSLGLRTDASNYSKEFSNMLKNWSPRFSLAYAMTSKLFVNFNTGRFIQQPSYTTLGFQDNEGNLVNKNNKLKFITSDHVVLGLEYRRKAGSRITLEGFFKYYNNYPVSVTDSISLANKGGDFGVFGSEEVTSTGKGRAYGFEAYARERIMGKIDLIGSYTFVRSEFKNATGSFIPSSWDNRHIINITLAREFKKNWDAGIKWRFVGGAPYTPYDLDRSSLVEAWSVQPKGFLDYGRFNTLRFDGFHQLDIRIDKQYFFSKWSLTLYTDIQNAYNFQATEQPFLSLVTGPNGEPLTVENDPSRYQIKEVPSTAGTVLPTIGIIVEF